MFNEIEKFVKWILMAIGIIVKYLLTFAGFVILSVFLCIWKSGQSVIEFLQVLFDVMIK